jgi:hypothetical protein
MRRAKKIADYLQNKQVPLFGDYFGAESGERLMFWATLIGLIVGLVSGLYFASDQKEAAANLNARTKSAEISIQVMQQLDICRNSLIAAINRQPNLESIKASLIGLRLCRTQIGVSLAGLKALNRKLNFDGASEDYGAIKAIDDKTQKLIEKIRRIPNPDFLTQTELLEDVLDFIGTDTDLATTTSIYGLEEKLKR